jgi:apolipoprotein N-acyltransferase
VKSLLTGIKNFFWPAESALRLRRAELTFWAFLLTLTYLPLPFGFLAWFALARPIAIISRLEPREAFKAGYFYAFMSNLFHLYWVAYVTPPGMVAAIFILSLYPAVIFLLFNKLYRVKKWLGIILLPFLWVGMEYFRSLSEFAFPWTDLAYSQGYYLNLIQIAAIIGSYGLSLIIMYWNILIWQAIERGKRFEHRVVAITIFLATLAGLYAYGWIMIPVFEDEGKFNVSLLQGNVDLSTKWKEETRTRNFELYDSMATVAIRQNPHLIIWPETAAPCYPRHQYHYRRLLSRTARGTATTHLIGALDVVDFPDKQRSYNSAFQFSPEGEIEGVYHKIKLVPFSEHSPYQDHIPFLTRQFLEEYVSAIKTHDVQWWSDFYPGDSIVLFRVDTTDYSILICFEIAFPDYVRQGVLKGARFLANITNDTWFGRSPGPFQHMRIAIFRAVENRIWLARCANSGISAVIDPYGRERVRAGLYVRDILSHGIIPREDFTVFTAIGPIVGQVSLWVVILVVMIFISRLIILKGVKWLYGKRL